MSENPVLNKFVQDIDNNLICNCTYEIGTSKETILKKLQSLEHYPLIVGEYDAYKKPMIDILNSMNIEQSKVPLWESIIDVIKNESLTIQFQNQPKPNTLDTHSEAIEEEGDQVMEHEMFEDEDGKSFPANLKDKEEELKTKARFSKLFMTTFGGLYPNFKKTAFYRCFSDFYKYFMEFSSNKFTALLKVMRIDNLIDFLLAKASINRKWKIFIATLFIVGGITYLVLIFFFDVSLITKITIPGILSSIFNNSD